MGLSPQFYHQLAGYGGHEHVLCRPPTPGSVTYHGPQLLCSEIQPCPQSEARLPVGCSQPVLCVQGI